MMNTQRAVRDSSRFQPSRAANVRESTRFHRADAEGEGFRLDAVNECLWKQTPDAPEQRIPVKPKPFAVLQYLVAHADRLITHDEFLDALWPGVCVQPEVLKSQILTLRSVLGDDARSPHFIETVSRRGYRFIARIATDRDSSEVAVEPTGHAPLVGRQQPLSELNSILQRTIRQRQAQIVFVTGESGIGKTSLVDEFLRRTREQAPQVRVARGQCVEGYGSRESYYPVFEALSDLFRGQRGRCVLREAAACAPSWLAQIPGLMPATQRALLQGIAPDAGPERMLRELKILCERLTLDGPIVLVLEDLQWIDPCTAGLIDVLARSRSPMQLLLIGTYRTTDSTSGQHPLRTLVPELQLHRLCGELRLAPLTEQDVAAYLATQGVPPPPDGLGAFIHRRTEGNPLFMVTLLAHLCEQGLLSMVDGRWQLEAPLSSIASVVPDRLRDMIEARLERLSAEERRALQVASVSGVEFDVQWCAQLAGMLPERLDELCAALADRHFMLRRVPGDALWTPNDSPRYAFAHVMYREVLCQRAAVGLRAVLQQPVPAQATEQVFWTRQAEQRAANAFRYSSGSTPTPAVALA